MKTPLEWLQENGEAIYGEPGREHSYGLINAEFIRAIQADAIEAARGLVERLRFIADDPKYRAVWEIHQLHNGPYSGPQYVGAFDALVDALAALPSGPCVVVPVETLDQLLNGIPDMEIFSPEYTKRLSALANQLRALLTAQMPQGEEG